MNTPNRLTVARLLLVPVFVAVLLLPQIPFNHCIALALFAIASFTDFLDGHIARKHGLVTDFGKLMDPLADKVLVISALVCFVQLDIIGAVPVIIILAREFFVVSLRLIAVQKNKVIAADIWGKVKTVTQMITTMLILLFQDLIRYGVLAADGWASRLTQGLIWLVVALTILSGVNYGVCNRDVFRNIK